MKTAIGQQALNSLCLNFPGYRKNDIKQKNKI